jgi:photosystem II stability/assembly factor-like uncharacterized protein/pimeloyl-ACP methyl ester carboxylesterase
MKKWILCCTLVCNYFLVIGQELPRKFWNGFRVVPVTDSIAIATNAKHIKGLYVTEVLPNGSAAAAKILTADIVLSINNKTVNSMQDIAAINGVVEGATIKYNVLRNGVEQNLIGDVKAKAKEASAVISYAYTSVKYNDGALGAIISKPINTNKKLPAVLFIQGYTCADMADVAAAHPYKRLCDELTQKGYIVMRVEKPGMGASKNTPACDEINYPQEFLAFENALLALKNNADVDANNIFIWGHSLGGIIAPGLTAKYPWVKGVAVYGTLANVWGEYYLKMIREQGKGNDVEPIALEKSIRAARIIIQKTHVEKMSIANLVKQQPNLKSALQTDFGWDGKSEKLNTRSLQYFQTLDEVNTMANWANTSSKVLSLYGTADIEVLDSIGAMDIVNTVNHYHPKTATYYAIKNTDHSFAKIGTLAQAYKARAAANYSTIMMDNYNPEIVNVTDAWMQSIIDTNTNFLKNVQKNANPYEWKKQVTEPFKGKQDDLFFSDMQHGWYGNGTGKIYATTDAGVTWQKVLDKPGYYVRCLAFVDSLHGFAGNVGTDYFPGVTDTTCMLETMDGGKTWAAVTNIKGPFPKGLCAMDIYAKLFVNAGKPGYKNTIRAAGRVGSPAFMMTSKDDGKTWVSQDMSAYTQMIFDIHFVSENVGFICGATDADVEKANALILKTIDGGATWQKVYQSNRPFELTWKCSFPSENVGYVTIQSYNQDDKATARYVAKTSDGGDTWQEMLLDNDMAVREFGIAFVDENLGWVGTTTGGYQTTNGGKSWIKTDLGKYTNKFRIIPNGKAKRVVGLGNEIWQLDVN